MLITSAEVILVEIPFELRGTGIGIMPTAWSTLEFALVKLTDDLGNIGWGEGFGYSLIDATKSVLERLVFPSLIGQTITHIGDWNRLMQRKLHMFGRYGVTVFAISGVDIALWDLAAKRQGKPLRSILSDESGRSEVPFYASLVRYSDPELVKKATREVLDAGFRKIKLHEIDVPIIKGCRDFAGRDVSICVDVNCAWSSEFVIENIRVFKELGLAWLEEPIFPPEDFIQLRNLRGSGIPIAAGENWCTAHQMKTALAAEAVDFLQPSITKVGGVTEMVAAVELARRSGVRVMPHTPYFGPGLYAALQIAGAYPDVEALEYNFVRPKAWLCEVEAIRKGESMRITEEPGIGFEPDPEVLMRFGRKIGERHL